MPDVNDNLTPAQRAYIETLESQAQGHRNMYDKMVGDLLREHELDHLVGKNADELAKEGYMLLQNVDIKPEGNDYTLNLCKIIDTSRFTIKAQLDEVQMKGPKSGRNKSRS